jgi:hypothetical protein
MSHIIAIPSENPGGLDANLGAHFGHCDLYTLVSVENGKVAEVKVIPNVPHQQGGCLAPVQHLAQNGVKQLIAGGMGLRPLMGFNRWASMSSTAAVRRKWVMQSMRCWPARCLNSNRNIRVGAAAAPRSNRWNRGEI